MESSAKQLITRIPKEVGVLLKTPPPFITGKLGPGENF